jgi:lysozyme
VDLWLDEDADSVEEDLRHHLPWVFEISENRQQVFFDLMFNMGWPKLSGFPNFLKHAENGEWDIAATHLLLSKYASQVGKRAKINAQMLREG